MHSCEFLRNRDDIYINATTFIETTLCEVCIFDSCKNVSNKKIFLIIPSYQKYFIFHVIICNNYK